MQVTEQQYNELIDAYIAEYDFSNKEKYHNSNDVKKVVYADLLSHYGKNNPIKVSKAILESHADDITESICIKCNIQDE